MHLAVVLARLERLGVAYRLLPPPSAIGAGLRFASVDDPHHPGKKSVAPMRPGLASVLPATLHCVHGVKVRMLLDQAPNLALGEVHGGGKGLGSCFGLKFDHRMPL